MQQFAKNYSEIVYLHWWNVHIYNWPRHKYMHLDLFLMHACHITSTWLTFTAKLHVQLHHTTGLLYLFTWLQHSTKLNYVLCYPSHSCFNSQQMPQHISHNWKTVTKFYHSIMLSAWQFRCCKVCYSTSPTMFLTRSATNGTEPGLLCARRFASL